MHFIKTMFDYLTSSFRLNNITISSWPTSKKNISKQIQALIEKMGWFLCKVWVSILWMKKRYGSLVLFIDRDLSLPAYWFWSVGKWRSILQLRSSICFAFWVRVLFVNISKHSSFTEKSIGPLSTRPFFSSFCVRTNFTRPDIFTPHRLNDISGSRMRSF